MRNVIIALAMLLPVTGCVMRGNVNCYSLTATTEGSIEMAARENGGPVNAEKEYSTSTSASRSGSASSGTDRDGDAGNGGDDRQKEKEER